MMRSIFTPMGRFDFGVWYLGITIAMIIAIFFSYYEWWLPANMDVVSRSISSSKLHDFRFVLYKGISSPNVSFFKATYELLVVLGGILSIAILFYGVIGLRRWHDIKMLTYNKKSSLQFIGGFLAVIGVIAFIPSSNAGLYLAFSGFIYLLVSGQENSKEDQDNKRIAEEGMANLKNFFNQKSNDLKKARDILLSPKEKENEVSTVDCHACGKSNNEDVKFCSECGTMIKRPI